MKSETVARVLKGLTVLAVAAVFAVVFLRHGVSALPATAVLAGCALMAFALMASVVVEAPGRVATQVPSRDLEATQALRSQEETRPLRTERKRALIIGGGALGRILAESLEAAGRCQVVGFIDDGPGAPAGSPWPVLGRRADTESVVAEYAIAEVFIAYAPTWQQCLAESLTADFPSVDVHVVPTSYEALLCTSRVESYGDVAVVCLTSGARRATEAIKRAFDVTVALGGLLLLLPVSLLTALAVRLSSPGPVLFAQERVGRFGRSFRMFKFRTMVCDAERETGPVKSVGKGDARLTGLGRWLRLCRVDEIPQLWNVLRGDMSMVGPRPERGCFVREYTETTPTYARRHQVRPGITGLAQICGGYHTDARDKLRFDLIYVSHQSLWLDLSILLRTVLVVCLPQPRKFEKTLETTVVKKFEEKNAVRQ